MTDKNDQRSKPSGKWLAPATGGYSGKEPPAGTIPKPPKSPGSAKPKKKETS